MYSLRILQPEVLMESRGWTS